MVYLVDTTKWNTVMTTQQAFDLEKLTGESLNYKNEKEKHQRS